MPFFLVRKKSLIILAVLVFFHLVLISIQVPRGNKESFFEKTIFSVFSPIQHGFIAFYNGIGKMWERYFILRDVEKDNEKLKDEVFLLHQENLLLRNSLNNLKGEIEVQETLRLISENIIHVRVIGFDFSKYHKSLTINKGSLDGIMKNMVVLDRYGNLVGKVIGSITLKEARVQLITDEDSGVGVFVVEKGVNGIISGDGKGRCEFKYVLNTEESIFPGDQVITSGYDGIFPDGIKVGEIYSFNRTEDLFMGAVIKPYFKFQELDHLAVIANASEIQ
jgi:rod shape-determining protein MreC